MTEIVETITPGRSRISTEWLSVRGKYSLGTWLASACVAVAAVITVAVPFLPLEAPDYQNLSDTLSPISAEHLLGTDDLGRDLFSRLLWGIHTSFLAAVTAVAIALVIGLPFGLIAGYRGGIIDQIVSRSADVVLTVPALILLLAAQTALDTGIQGQMAVLGLILAPRIMRVIRVQTQSLVKSPYVTAGRMAGSSHARILGRYLLPGVRTQLAVQVSYLLGLALVVEAGISFLGIGVKPPDSSLGTLLIGASAMLSNEPRVVLIPAAVLTLLILSFNVLGDARTKGRKK